MTNYTAPRPALQSLAGLLVPPLLCLAAAMGALPCVADDEGVQILTRGPIHEAFAAASMSGSMAGIVVARSPYEPITEMPPDQRPEGDDVTWIPGYWSWDDDRNDFIWVSGVWRDLPPGRQWVPGYWASASGGSQWISGFWGDVVQEEVTYLPPPPEPLEAGPSSPQPGPGTSWAPGCWIWQQTRYDWQPGYWVAPQPQWVWSPAHYIWTPRGHIYVPGYWDHDLGHRGVMFAPVYYQQPIYARPNYYYSPVTIIDLAVVVNFMFVQPRSRHYYFGDYYDRRYEDRGYYPWHSRQVAGYGYDPLYLQFRAEQLRSDRDWDIHVEDLYRQRRDHAEYRPPQTLAIQINLLKEQRSDSRENVVIGRNYRDAIASRTQTQRFATVDAVERGQYESRGREVRKLQMERATLENSPAATERQVGRTPDAAPARVRMPRSPVAARPIDSGGRTKTPPPAPAVPAARTSERTTPPGGTPIEVTNPARRAPVQSDAPQTRGPRRDSTERAPGPVAEPQSVERKTPDGRTPIEVSNPARRAPVQLDAPQTREPRRDNPENTSGPVTAPRTTRPEAPQGVNPPRPRGDTPRVDSRAPERNPNDKAVASPSREQVRPPASRVESTNKREPLKAKRPKSNDGREQVKPRRSPSGTQTNLQPSRGR